MVKKHVTVPGSGQRGRGVSILAAWWLHKLPQTPAPPSTTSIATIFIGPLLQQRRWGWEGAVSISFYKLLSMSLSKCSLKSQGKDIFCLLWTLGWSGLISHSMGCAFYKKHGEILSFWGISACKDVCLSWAWEKGTLQSPSQPSITPDSLPSSAGTATAQVLWAKPE